MLDEAYQTKDKDQIVKANQLKESATIGAIESWLQQPIDKLYKTLETLDPKWEDNKANPDILKHLAALHDALTISEKLEGIKS